MDTTEYVQQEEITALQSIYGDDFIECPPPKAWKVRAVSQWLNPTKIIVRALRDYMNSLYA